jgi:thiosulfate dehydrogenase (quinone) large subunit
MSAIATPQSTVKVAPAETPVIRSAAARRVMAGLRIVIGWTFLWAFLDKAFALGFSTEAGNGWIEGGSPTTGYLMGASEGWFGGMWSALAGTAFADWLFMLGLLGLGVAAILGIGLRVAAVAGVLMAVFMYASQLPITAGATNPVTTAHWYYAFLFVLFPLVDAGRTWGLAGAWERVPFVRGTRWLR